MGVDRKDEIQNELNALWAGVIKSYEFDILHHRISLNVVVIENGQNSNHHITFKGVSSYHFYHDSGERRLCYLEPDNDDYLELTSIQYFKNGIGNIYTESSSEKWAKKYYSNANFTLEIWNSMLFIESNKIILNDIEYDLR